MMVPLMYPQPLHSFRPISQMSPGDNEGYLGTELIWESVHLLTKILKHTRMLSLRYPRESSQHCSYTLFGRHSLIVVSLNSQLVNSVSSVRRSLDP